MDLSLELQNFTIISAIGKGTYAKVFLARQKKDNKLYAIKVLKKKYIIEKHQQTHIMTQKQILADVTHPFLVKLKSTFQDQKKLYFVLEYCPGGELFNLLAAKDKLNEEQARFYATQIILALEELHSKKIIYRDLKPENIIIDKLGYIKLTDFGLSKILNTNEEVTNSICGTPEYLAPQIIKKQGHGTDVDWWCLGCLIYEMIAGFPPYHNDNRMQLFESIVHKNVNVTQFSPKLQDLFKKLLHKQSKKRLGHNGSEEIKKHPWFEKVNWKSIYEKKVKAPFAPELKSETDTKNFDLEVVFVDEEMGSYEDTGPIQGQDKFKNFTFDDN